ncbi:MAG: YicC family protein [Rikenellaceae bacterium]|jgi:uncharacterized protein (TIGR00255 family)|nr:YicC family protein [Rikenellaceae bacterium]
MIKSMTGYGKAEAQAGTRKITVEVRSLNSKQLDLTVKAPSIYRPYEYEIRAEAAKRLQRGKADIHIGYESDNATGTVTLNRTAFNDYFRQLTAICHDNGLDIHDPPMAANAVQAVLRLPEVVQNEVAALPEDEAAALKRAVTEAFDRFDAFRAQEGAILIADLLERVTRIETLRDEVAPYESARCETVKKRIRETVEAMKIPVDSNRLEQEMIFYVEKLDITEEKVRLTNHCNYFREVVREEEGVGRKLGFIAQEMGREINTMGSKANEANIQKIVVRMKDELEKIKEQLLNIL